jgi:diguanylate cyclase (GGDEF)-like protein
VTFDASIKLRSHAADGVYDADIAASEIGHPMREGQPGQVALGRAAHERRSEISERVVGLWRKYCPAAASCDDRVRHDIVRTTEAATDAITAYLVDGAQQTAEQKRVEAATGKAPLRESISLTDLTKLYLFWRDTIMDVLRQEATRLGLDQRISDTAIQIVRGGSDASIVRMVKQFDAERERLQEELQREQAQLAHEALHDSLTGLPNRKLFFDRLTQAFARAARNPSSVGVLFIDIDDFKAVNDTWGHLVGDQLLVAVASRLRDRVRPSDTVARLGGDEFVVLYERLDGSEETGALRERIQDAFAEPFTIAALGLEVSASVGFAAATTDCDPDILLTQADHAMYRAKRALMEPGMAAHDDTT